MSDIQARIIAQLEHLNEHAAEAKAAVDGPYLQGYLEAIRHALDLVRKSTDTPCETPTERVPAERADDRRTT